MGNSNYRIEDVDIWLRIELRINLKILIMISANIATVRRETLEGSNIGEFGEKPSIR